MSGTTSVPRCTKMSSASGVSGPLAASPMILALTFGAFSSSITFSSAAGIISRNPSPVHRHFLRNFLRRGSLEWFPFFFDFEILHLHQDLPHYRWLLHIRQAQ